MDGGVRYKYFFSHSFLFLSLRSSGVRKYSRKRAYDCKQAALREEISAIHSALPQMCPAQSRTATLDDATRKMSPVFFCYRSDSRDCRHGLEPKIKERPGCPG